LGGNYANLRVCFLLGESSAMVVIMSIVLPEVDRSIEIRSSVHAIFAREVGGKVWLRVF
jgi:hypothetical protein